MIRYRRSVRSLALATVGALAVVPLVGLTPSAAVTTSAAAAAVPDCPPGTVATSKTAGQRAQERSNADPAFQELLGSLDAAAADRATLCRPVREPEPFHELAVRDRDRNVLTAGPMGYTPPGALRAAVNAKDRSTANAASVPGARGTFTPLGTTPLISDDERFEAVNGTGLADLAGRVDSFTYDPVNQRLFAAPGTGGVWVTTNLGESWRSVGDGLPYQSVGAVTWSPAGRPQDGTLLVVSGEASAGGNVYTGMGAFYSTDSGRTWQESTGIPDGLMGFQITVDPTDPNVVYAATSQGLYRSADAGKTYANVELPTGDCAGVTGVDNVCQHANWVTDVVVQAPGGTTDEKGGRVLAAVGYRAGGKAYPGTSTPQSPRNGLYRSETGEVGSFAYLEDIYAADDTVPTGFATQRRVGRTELGAAVGPEQDHNYLYAIVQDAVLFNGGTATIDAYDPTVATGPTIFNTALNGIYVSADFGSSWTRMADELELQSPLTESALIGTAQALFYAPGIQSWYNMWIKPDPSMADADGVPTRLTFGLEEVWESRFSGQPQDGRAAAEPVSFRVIGPYFADEVCLFLSLGLPSCPTTQTTPGETTTHPDQQGGIWIPGPDGEVTLVVGNDGGVNTQTVAPGEALSKQAWGRGAQDGFNTLLPYHVAPAKDGTVWYGLQDNGSGKIEPNGRQVMTYGGDGFFVAVDPDDSDIAYSEHTFASLRVTQDGGRSWRTISPPVSAPLFSNPFVMDPTDAQHLMAGGPEIVERTQGPAGSWVEVFNVATDEEPGRQVTAVALHGDAAYAGFCSTCDIVNKDPEKGQVFSSGLATNVGGDEEPEAGTPAGWHFVEAKGLPDRYISSIAVDPADDKTLYVTLAGYANRQWWPVGSFNDANPNVGEGHVFKSTDGGQSFTDITGSLPDVPARWVELNRGQLLVGTDVGVFLSNNTAGQRWAALEGLPHAPVTSIRNVPGKVDEVVVSTFGRGVYRYTFSSRPGSQAVAGPGSAPGPALGSLPATGLDGLGLTVTAVGLLALVGGLAVRRRLTA
jgi:photosystem II stability/assembly factor-like uncharacterized protein